MTISKKELRMRESSESRRTPLWVPEALEMAAITVRIHTMDSYKKH